VSSSTSSAARLSKAIQRPLAEIEGAELWPLPCVPDDARLARAVVPSTRSRTNTSHARFVSFGSRFSAVLANATWRPSEETLGFWLIPLACVPAPRTLTRSVVAVVRSRRNTSQKPFVSPAARFDAWLSNATQRPSAEIDGLPLPAFAWPPPVSTLARSVVPATRSRTKTSAASFVSEEIRVEASLTNAT
jgi:hypothetical protein